MTLTTALTHRDALRALGIKCQVIHSGSQVWQVVAR